MSGGPGICQRDQELPLRRSARLLPAWLQPQLKPSPGRVDGARRVTSVGIRAHPGIPRPIRIGKAFLAVLRSFTKSIEGEKPRGRTCDTPGPAPAVHGAADFIVKPL
jgi:hypothetical protein